MNTVIALYVTAQGLISDAKERLADEDGQTTMEWMGIAAIVVGILAILLQAAPSIGATVKETWEGLFGAATGTGG